MATLEELVVRIKADSSQLQRELSKVNSEVKQSANNFAGLGAKLAGAFAVGTILAFTKRAIDAGDALGDLSKITGTSVEMLSSLQLYAKQSGSSIEALGHGIKFMNRNLAEAQSGNKQAVESFTQLGLSIEDLSRQSTEEQILTIAQYISELGTEAERTKALMDIFDRRGAELGPMMREGAAGIREAMEEAKELGLVLSQEEVDRMDDFNDKWATATTKLERLAQDGFVVLYDAAADLFNLLKDPSNQSAWDKFFKYQVDATLAPGMNKWKQRAQEMGYVTEATSGNVGVDLAGEYKQRYGSVPSSGRRLTSSSRNTGVDSAKSSLEAYNRELLRGHEIAQLTAKDQAGAEAYYKTIDLAQKAGIKNTQEMADKNRILAESNYEVAEAQAESARFAGELKDRASDALSEIIVGFDDAGESVRRFALELAKIIIERKITGPLSEGIIDSIDTGGVGGSIWDWIKGIIPGFATGNFNVQRDMLANVHKGEMIVPAAQASQIRSGGADSKGITIIQHNSFGAGVSRSELESILPAYSQATYDAVFASMRRGGAASRVVGLR